MNSANIEALLVRKYGKIRRGKGQNGPEIIINCPFCKHKFKVYINVIHGMFHCFRCGEAGSINRLIEYTPQKAHVETPVFQALPTDVVMPGTLVELTSLDSDHPALKYIRNRNFNITELNDVYGVRYCAEGQVFAERYDTTNTLIFPMWMNNKLIGWQSRLLYNPDELTDDDCAAMGMIQDEDGDYVKPPKYWTSPGFEKGRVLFNNDWARHSDVVVVCEGTFDAMAVGKCAVATLGKGVTDMQARLIEAYWQVVILLLDPGDADDEMAALRSRFWRLLPSVQVGLVGYKDAGEAPRIDIWKQIIAAAEAAGIDLFKYKLVV